MRFKTLTPRQWQSADGAGLFCKADETADPNKPQPWHLPKHWVADDWLPVSRQDQETVYLPLAWRLASRILRHQQTGGGPPFLVGLSGPVAVGKSSAARLLAGLLAGLPFGIKAATVCTDGFLWPNHILEAQNMLARKGFPESYDNRALTGFLIDLRRGLPVQAPLYSHTAYDILPGQTQPVQGVQAVVVEGVNILGQAPLESGPRDLAPFFDCALYLDGPQPLVREWYLERFMALRKAALHQPNAYFARYAALDEAAALKQAQRIWETVNRPNLIQHIHPSRKNAHLVLEAQADHTIGSIHLKTQ